MKITESNETPETIDRKALQREILLGFWKIHILHHAGEGPVVGQWMLNELRSHGYDVSPGTLYPILHRMERLGWLKSESESDSAKAKCNYYLTDHGKEVLVVVKRQIQELTDELNQ